MCSRVDRLQPGAGARKSSYTYFTLCLLGPHQAQGACMPHTHTTAAIVLPRRAPVPQVPWTYRHVCTSYVPHPSCRDTSPVTQSPLPHKMLTPSLATKAALMDYLQRGHLGM